MIHGAWKIGAKKLSAKSYVQDGLIAMWDGIENAGWGVHDPNATVWRNLIDGNRNISLNAQVHTVTSNSVEFLWQKNSPAKLSSAIPDPRFCELCVMVSDSRELAIFYPGGNQTWMWYYNGSLGAGQRKNGYPILIGDTYTLSAGFVGGSSEFNAVALNGVVSPPMGANNVYYYFHNYGFSFRNDYPFAGKIFCCRIYNRTLTAAEITHNYAVDVQRFNLPTA